MTLSRNLILQFLSSVKIKRTSCKPCDPFILRCYEIKMENIQKPRTYNLPRVLKLVYSHHTNHNMCQICCQYRFSSYTVYFKFNFCSLLIRLSVLSYFSFPFVQFLATIRYRINTIIIATFCQYFFNISYH